MAEEKRDFTKTEPGGNVWPSTKEEALDCIKGHGQNTRLANACRVIFENELQRELLDKQDEFQGKQLSKTARLIWATWFMAVGTWGLVIATVLVTRCR